MHNNLRGELQTIFAEVFDPQLIGVLRGQLQPLQHGITEILKAQDSHAKVTTSEAQLCHGERQELRNNCCASRQFSDQQVQAIISKLEGQDVNLKAVSEAIKQHISVNIRNVQNQLMLSGTSQVISTLCQQDGAQNDLMDSSLQEHMNEKLSRETLREV